MYYYIAFMIRTSMKEVNKYILNKVTYTPGYMVVWHKKYKSRAKQLLRGMAASNVR